MTSPTCGACHDFEAGSAVLEAALAGLAALSSGFGATRAGDGHCRRHDRLLHATASCPAFTPRGRLTDAG